jgi:hypothetical protein
MSYEGELVTMTIGTPTAGAEQAGLSAAIDELEDDLAEEEVEAQQIEESPDTVCEEPQVAAATPRVSYGLVDILFPVTPPKPKGARLVRGPLKFHQP